MLAPPLLPQLFYQRVMEFTDAGAATGDAVATFDQVCCGGAAGDRARLPLGELLCWLPSLPLPARAWSPRGAVASWRSAQPITPATLSLLGALRAGGRHRAARALRHRDVHVLAQAGGPGVARVVVGELRVVCWVSLFRGWSRECILRGASLLSALHQRSTPPTPPTPDNLHAADHAF